MPNAKDNLKRVPKGALKNFLDAGKTTTRVIGKVERFVLSKPVNTSRATDALHPSAMVGKFWCHRTSYYNLQGYVLPSAGERSFKRELIFAQGHGIHETWQNWLGDMGRLYGVWQCTECKMADWLLSPALCPKCDEPTMEYREVPVEYPPLRIKGHADGWLKGFGSDLLMEIKSVGLGTFMWLDRPGFMEAEQNFDKAWKNLRSPFESHVAQVQLYMKILELSGREDVPQEAVMIYEAKPTQEIKEFVIQKDDWAVGEIIAAAEMVVKSVEDGKPPLCNIGGSAGCKQCTDLEAFIAQEQE